MPKKAARRASVGAVLLLSLAGPAYAQSSDIPWVWNSDDFDVQARFESDGEHIYAQEYRPSTYVDWQYSNSLSRWWIPGDGDRIVYDLNLDFPEDRSFGINVCQYHSAWPDDCSQWNWGRT